MRVFCPCCLVAVVLTSEPPVVAAEPSPANAFEKVDQDQNGFVTIEEFLADPSNDQRSDARWEFYERDVNADGVVSKAEYEAPEPENKFLGMFRSYDQDKDDLLSRAEFVDPAGEQFAEAAKQEFHQFDANRDGRLSFEEFLFTPRPALTPAGRFSRIDANQDGMITRPEFFRQYADPNQVSVRTNFYGMETDGDGKVSRKEYLAPTDQKRPHLRSRFAMRDLDDDGRLSHSEYFTPFVGGKWEEAAKNEATQFDIDKDGVLTLTEFAMAPQPGYVRPFLFDLFDENEDESLSRDEYLNPYPAERKGVERITFYNRDANGDLSLSREEFLTPAESLRRRLRSEYAARDADDDGKMAQVEYFTPFIGGKWEAAAKNEAVQFDIDGDGFLSLLEFALSPAGGHFPEDLFVLLDKNRDDTLSLREYVKPRPESRRIETAVAFYRRDRNCDGKLDLEELQGPADVPPPDPVAEKAEQAIESVLSVWSELDGDGNGTLNSKEWSKRPETLGAVGEFAFSSWDLDADKELSPDEFRTVVSASWGIRRLDGKPLRQPQGTVVNWAHIDAIDVNHDNVLSRSEYLKRFPDDPQAAHRFSELDEDDDDEMNDVELIERHLFAIDPLWDFCRIDADLDGQLSHEEVVASAQPWQQNMCHKLVNAYDANGNGTLDLVEYRMTPFANPVIEWYHGYKDTDNDGRLSWGEFFARAGPRPHPGSSLQFANIARDVFDHFDFDGDGFLTLPEFSFTVDIDRIPAEAAFVSLDRDKNGSLGVSDAGLEGPKSNDPTTVLQWEERTMQIEEALKAADRNADGKLSLDEFKAERPAVAAALTGRAVPRASIVTTGSSTARASSAESWNWRFLGLITFNILLLGGLGWLVLRKA